MTGSLSVIPRTLGGGEQRREKKNADYVTL